MNIIRLASNRNVWKKLSKQEQFARRERNPDNRGADAICREKYKLNKAANWDLECDEIS